MSQAPPDRNTLLGEFAVRLELLTAEALAEAVRAWERDPGTSLGQLLVTRGLLHADELVHLEALVESCLRRRAQAALGWPTLGTEGAIAATLTPDEGTSPPPGPPPGGTAGNSVASRYRVLRLHASGGLGEVFVALDEELQREVALKEIKARHAADPTSRQRFLLEGEVTGRLEHPGIVPVYGLGTHADGRPYYAMRFIKGNSLRHAIDHFHTEASLKADPGKRALELRQLLARFVAVCNAVAYAHSKGILHRDLKPGNVMLGNYGETLVVDWGLAKAIGRKDTQTEPEASVELRPSRLESDASLTQVGSVLGTPAYMSPEQASGRPEELGPASDVYSLGATLYHLLTGRAPFLKGDPYVVLEAVCRGQFPRPREIAAEVPVALEAVCLKAMARQAGDRYASAKDLAEEIEHWLADEPVTAYAEPLRLRLSRWRRRHPALVTGTAALVFTVAVALGVGFLLLSAEQARTHREQHRRALAQVDELLNATPKAVPIILDGLEPYREQIRPRLREVSQQAEPRNATAAARKLWQQHRTRAALALLPDDAEQMAFLRERLLAEDIEPEETLLVRDQVAAHARGPDAKELTKQLWAEAGQREANAGRRFRAFLALARLDPDDPRWRDMGPDVVRSLLAFEPLYARVWSVGLRDVKEPLLAPLAEAFRDHKRPPESHLATLILLDYAEDNPVLLADLLADADPRQFSMLLPSVRLHGERAVDLLHKELDRKPERDSEKARDALAQRQANAAVALLKLGRAERVWPLFRLGAYPDLRTHLLHRAGWLGADVRLLLDRLAEEEDASARQALILALGEYRTGELPVGLRREWTERLLHWYRDDPDPGVHAAIDWLLRHAREGPQPRKHNWGQAKKLAQIDEELRGRPAAGGRRWYVTGQGQTMVLLGADEFLMGSPEGEQGRDDDELLHQRRVGRRVAVASKKVTVGQFKRFLAAHPEVKYSALEKFSPEADGPIVLLTWYEAAQYCRWLSEQEGVEEDQMCYPLVAEIEKCKDGKKPLKLPSDYLSRTGYRLPSEAEWEFACRAGTRTSRFYGSSEEMLAQHAWYNTNAEDRTWPGGQKKPNGFGLFDALGNAYDWCQESARDYARGTGEKPAADEEDKREVTDAASRVRRGGSFTDFPSRLRAAFRSLRVPPSNSGLGSGFRVVRTYR
jgi:serine/threonine protein kinase/formylglycine-generating enzyme required for sulfatase activity